MQQFGEYVFGGAPLTTLDLSKVNHVVKYGSNTIDDATIQKIIVPNHLVNIYKSCEGWRDFSSKIVSSL